MTTHGGKRPGSGRKANSGAFKEPTRALRVPESQFHYIKTWLNELHLCKAHAEYTSLKSDPSIKNISKPHIAMKPLLVPLYQSTVSAGFPSPADDVFDLSIDLNQHLIRNPPSTFLVKVSGDSMVGASIHSGDLLVVDRSITPKNNDIVIAAVNGELTVKRLLKSDTNVILKAENPEFSSIVIVDGIEVIIWGVVTNVVHNLLSSTRGV